MPSLEDTVTVRPAGDTDEEQDLLRRCLQGDSAGWEEFLKKYHGVIEGAVRFTFLRCLYRVSPPDVENVVQELYARLYEQDFRRLRSFQGRCPLGVWLKSLAIRATLNYLRDEKLRGRFGGGGIEDLALQAAPDPSGVSSSEEREDVRRLDVLVDQLSPLQRASLKMFYYDGLSYRRISLLLGVPVQTLGSLISRAKDRLRQLLGSSRPAQ